MKIVKHSTVDNGSGEQDIKLPNLNLMYAIILYFALKTKVENMSVRENNTEY